MAKQEKKHTDIQKAVFHIQPIIEQYESRNDASSVLIQRLRFIESELLKSFFHLKTSTPNKQPPQKKKRASIADIDTDKLISQENKESR